MTISCLPPGNIGLLLITEYDRPVKSFMNFHNVDREKPCGSSSLARNNILPQP